MTSYLESTARQTQSWPKQHPSCNTAVTTPGSSIHIRFPDAELHGRWPPLPLPLETNYPTYGGGERTPRAVGGRGEIQGVVRHVTRGRGMGWRTRIELQNYTPLFTAVADTAGTLKRFFHANQQKGIQQNMHKLDNVLLLKKKKVSCTECLNSEI